MKIKKKIKIHLFKKLEIKIRRILKRYRWLTTGKYKYRFCFFEIGVEGGRWGIYLKYETILNTVNSCHNALKVWHASNNLMIKKIFRVGAFLFFLYKRLWPWDCDRFFSKKYKKKRVIIRSMIARIWTNSVKPQNMANKWRFV